jgi:hypothetical protein
MPAISMSDVWVGNRQLTGLEAEVLEVVTFAVTREPETWHESRSLFPANDNASTARRTALARLSSMGVLKAYGIESRPHNVHVQFRRTYKMSPRWY